MNTKCQRNAHMDVAGEDFSGMDNKEREKRSGMWDTER
jgi:hypothetical protein